MDGALIVTAPPRMRAYTLIATTIGWESKDVLDGHYQPSRLTSPSVFVCAGSYFAVSKTRPRHDFDWKPHADQSVAAPRGTTIWVAHPDTTPEDASTRRTTRRDDLLAAEHVREERYAEAAALLDRRSRDSRTFGMDADADRYAALALQCRARIVPPGVDAQAWQRALAAARALLDMNPEIGQRSALKQAASDAGVAFGADMGRFVEWAEAMLGVG